ncbi:MAG: RagB/SusD family nutrient uptake outer membrane protein [Draconibacterium sp.]
MMKQIYIVFLVTLFLFSFSGCNEDFLNVQPTEFLTVQQIAEASKDNPDVGAAGIRGLYTLMFKTGTGGTERQDDFGQKGFDIYSDFLSSDMVLSASAWGWYRYLTEYNVTTDYTQIENEIVWTYYYKIIRSANSIIAALGGNNIVPELEENRHTMGQAKTMRAYGYFYLTQFFIPSYNPSIQILPLYTDPTSPNQPKSITQKVYDLIVSDLTDAISLLETFNRSAKNEVNKYVAEGLLAYTYAAMGDDESLGKAKSLTDDIIANGGFPIMTAEEIVFTGDGNIGGFNNVNTPGWMWGVDITLDHGLEVGSWWGQMDRYSYSYQMAGDRKAIDKGLYDAIPEDDVRKGQFNPTSTSSYYLVPSNKFYDPNRVTGGQANITTDYVYMRVAEMYLLNAETAAKTGDEATARESLKGLMSKRVPDTSYIDGLSGQSLLNEIYLQTRIELWGEGKSYLAMKRNKATIVRSSNHLSYVGIPIAYDDPRLTFSIPQSEIQNNPFIN